MTYVPAQVTNVSTSGGLQQILIIEFAVDAENNGSTEDDNLITYGTVSFDPIPLDGEITDPIQDPIEDPIDDGGGQSPIDQYLPDNKIQVAPNHPIFVNGAFKEASQIQVGDKLTTIDGRQATVTSITNGFLEVHTYDLSLDSYNVYFANGILVGDKEILQGIDTDNQNTGFVQGTKIAIIQGLNDSSKLVNNQEYDTDLDDTDQLTDGDEIASFREFIVFKPF